MSERELERAVRKLLVWLGAWLYEWTYRTGADTTAKKGMPDIVGCFPPGKFFAIELKSPNARRGLTPEQQAEIAAIQRAGGLAFMATSVEEVIAALATVDPTLAERVRVTT
jgi:hypothetical protein